MSVTIYHNPRCNKSRQTLALLEAGGARVVAGGGAQDPVMARRRCPAGTVIDAIRPS